MSALKEDLKSANQKINWYPEHIRDGRFGEWLENVKDWAISRERYWGTPLPIWICEACRSTTVVGGFEELADLAKNPKSEIRNPNFDPHRPFIDEITLPCKCGGVMKRVPEVADCWFDSGSMPLAQLGYPHVPTSKSQIANSFPADYICEAIDQTRGWFYTLLAVATLMKKSSAIKEIPAEALTPPYKNVICLGLINDKDGQKMSKSKGNIVDPWKIINQYGVDALRFHLFTMNQPGEPKNFDPKGVDEVVKKTFLILFNVLAFYEMYSGEESAPTTAPVSTNVLDRWVLALWQKTVRGVTNNLDSYEILEAGRALAEFVTELSTWYVRRSRDRFKLGGDDAETARKMLGYILKQIAIVLAPFTPFIAEELYGRVKGGRESVHLEDWPEATNGNDGVLVAMTKARQVVELALAKRAEAGIKIRQPLRLLTMFGVADKDVSAEVRQIIADEVNVLTVAFGGGEEFKVELDVVLDDELKAQGLVREFVRQVNALRKTQGLTIKDRPTLKVGVDEPIAAILQANHDTIVKGALLQEFTFDTTQHESTIDLEGITMTVELC